VQTSRLVYYKAQTAHPLLPDPIGKQAIIDYFRGFLSLACAHNTDYILDSVTWKAHMHWAGALGASERELHEANRGDSADGALTGGVCLQCRADPPQRRHRPASDAYAPDMAIAMHEAEHYHTKQIGWLAETDVDMVTALTCTHSDEASGLVLAARRAGLPVTEKSCGA
jgi:S-methylmethionine-dependent homocysteine/selenocysteine methylase